MQYVDLLSFFSNSNLDTSSHDSWSPFASSLSKILVRSVFFLLADLGVDLVDKASDVGLLTGMLLPLSLAFMAREETAVAVGIVGPFDEASFSYSSRHLTIARKQQHY